MNAPRSATVDIARGERFAFGRNWTRFLTAVDETRIAKAEASLRHMLAVEALTGKSFLDVGCGSGLFSLAASRLGARVHSFDDDPHSVACAEALKRQQAAGVDDWTIGQGSVLDVAYLRSLGVFDVVYSWGVLHHTGDMWKALDNIRASVAPRGNLFIAIYNDCGSRSRRWRWIKGVYNRLPRWLRLPYVITAVAPAETKEALRCLLAGRPGRYVRSWAAAHSGRGMSHWRDIVDWVGGYPYEVAAPEEIFEFYKARGFELQKLKCGGVGLGCNEYVFAKTG